MRKLTIIFLFLIIFFSCDDSGRKNKAIRSAPKQDTFCPPQVIILANLPDSLQPKIKTLDTMPKPRRVIIPSRSGGSYSITNAKGELTKIDLQPPISKSLPVLRNAKGETIKDSSGNSIIMGNGGKSNFTNFTTEHGLALDGISCSKLDRMGNLWFGTQGGGVSRYDGRSFVTFSPSTQLHISLLYYYYYYYYFYSTLFY